MTLRMPAPNASVSFPWGLPTQKSWFEQATPFAGEPLREPAMQETPLTLERLLRRKSVNRNSGSSHVGSDRND
jgi:hypothetical protein